MSDAPAPRLSVEALLTLRALLDHQPLLHAAIPTTPCVSQPEGACDAQKSSSSPTDARPLALHQRTRVAPVVHRQAPAMSRAHGPTAPPRQPQCPERGVSACAPRCVRPLSNAMPPSMSASPRAITSAPTPRVSVGKMPSPIMPAGWGVPRSP
jgi:hypothetical protein